MMNKKEIKFKAWDKINNKMYPIAGISFTNKDVWLQISDEQIMGANFNEIEIMQYTGLKDKNDKEIYEGHIVNLRLEGSCSEDSEDNVDGNYIGEVYFNNGYCVKTNNYCPSLTNYLKVSVEIIGNKFENNENY